MWGMLGFLVAAAIGLAVTVGASRANDIRRDDYPWNLEEVAKHQVGIVANLAGFAFTGVVLVVTLVRDKPGSAGISLDTVIVMFLVAYLYWTGSAFLISFLPHRHTAADFMQRIHFGLASTIEYRTVFLSWFALLPLLQANGLGRLLPLLYFMLPASLAIGSLLLAMAADGLGLLTVKEVYFSAAIGTGFALLYAAIVTFGAPAARSMYTALFLAVVVFCVNGAGFSLAALTPLSSRYAAVKTFYERYGRRIVIGDMQLTMVSLAFLWLAVVGAI